MTVLAPGLKTGRARQRALRQLAPFELKDHLIGLAKTNEQKSTVMMLNAGRGNPNWIATTPREAFFLLGHVRDWARAGAPGTSRRPRRDARHAGDRRSAEAVPRHAPGRPRGGLPRRGLRVRREKLGFDPDAFVHELVDSIIGTTTPCPTGCSCTPSRSSASTSAKEMCDGAAAQGARSTSSPSRAGPRRCATCSTALVSEPLLQQGRHHRARHADLHAVPRDAAPRATTASRSWSRSTQTARRRRATPGSTPTRDRQARRSRSRRSSSSTRATRRRWRSPRRRIRRIVDAGARPNARSSSSSPTTSTARSCPASVRSLADLPRNTIGVYSFSKYFGCTGWRLGVVAIHEQNVIDDAIAELPAAEKKRAAHAATRRSPRARRRSSSSTAWSPTAASVALNHTAGLSLPQQVQMALFAAVRPARRPATPTRRVTSDRAAAADAALKGWGCRRRARSLPRRLLRRARPRGVGPPRVRRRLRRVPRAHYEPSTSCSALAQNVHRCC